jgi:hypothetical protein
MRAFNEISLCDFENGRHGDIVREIQSKGKDYILKVDEQEFIEYLYQKYLLEPLQIFDETESIDTPRISKESNNKVVYGRSSYEVDVYSFTIRYKYEGSEELFRVHSFHVQYLLMTSMLTAEHKLYHFVSKFTSKTPKNLIKQRVNATETPLPT